MGDEGKSKDQLIQELVDLRQQVTENKIELQSTFAQLQQETDSRKLAEHELNEHQLFFQSHIDTIPNPIFYKDEKGLYQGCNTAFEGYCGFSKEEIIGKSVYNLLPKYQADKCLEMDELLLSDKRTQIYETSATYADGTVHDIIFNKATFINTNKIACIVGVINDITEHKKFGEALRESEERYRRLVELSPDLISVYSEGIFLFMNRAGAAFFGLESPTEIIGKPFMDFIHPDYKKMAEERVQMMQTEGNSVSMFEEKYISTNGAIIDIEVLSVPLTLQGKPAVQVIVRDITQLKRYEEALKSERLRLFSLLDSLPALIYLQAPDYSIHFSNRYFWERFGKPEGRSCYELFHGRKQPCTNCPRSLVLDTKKTIAFERTESDGRHYQLNMHPFSDIDGSSLVLVFGIDITEQKEAENKLQAAHQQLINIIEFLPDATFVIDSDKKVIAWNRALEEMVGVQKEQIIGKGDNAYAIPFYGQRVPLLIDRVLENDNNIMDNKYDFIERKGNKIFADGYVPSIFNGKSAYLCGVASPLFDRSGNMVGAIETIRDITERKQAEVSLRLSEERFYKVFNNSPLPMSISSFPDVGFLYVNESMERFTGYQREECIGRTLKELNLWVNPEDEAKMIQLFEEQGFVRNLEIVSRMKSGELRTGLFTAEYINFDGEQCKITVINDITKRKRTEVSLQLSEERFYKVFNNSPVPMCINSIPDGRFLYVNDSVEEFTGYQREECIGRTTHELDLWAREGDDAKFIRLLIDQGFVRNLEFESRMKSGELRVGLFSTDVINFENKQCSINAITDITELKRAETSLRLSEERFCKIFNNSPVPMSIHSFPDGRFLYVNDSLEKFNGYLREECIGRTPRELNSFANLEDEAKIIQLFLEQGFTRNLEICNRMKSGEIRVGLFSADFINIDGKECVLNVITDITERKQFEKEIFRLDRLNLIGEMAAGIGHEVRNPMTTVRGFLQILGAKSEYRQDKEYFDLMIGELDRANSIITEFLSLAKSKTIEYEINNINSIVETLLPLIQADALKDDKNLNVELAETQDLSLNEKEIRQLILNLVRNGLEAMSPEGNLTIRTFMDNEVVILSVQDQGNGIETEVLEKLGTPFFTTKENGTGLGLAVCYSIAARHNAKIEIESNSTGTTFFVRFNQTNQTLVMPESYAG